MFVPPENLAGARPPSRPFVPTWVRFNNVPRSDITLLSIHRTLGGGRLDTCELLIPSQEILVDWELEEGLETSVEAGITLNGKPIVLHWGTIATCSITTEGRAVYTSRTEYFHFGDPLRGMVERNPFGTATAGGGDQRFLVNDAPLICNPEIDGIVLPNCAPADDLPFAIFIDPESVRTPAAKKLQKNIEPQLWTLPKAVNYLCGVLNRSETYVKNPSAGNLLEILDGSEKLLQNFFVPNGLFLPQVLDYLLAPFGYTWYVNYEEPGSRRIVVLKRGAGDVTTLLMQRPGESLDLRATNTERFTFDYNVAAAQNTITTLGDFPYMEGTFRLYPAWDSSLDNLSLDKLALDSAEYRDNPAHWRVWREWVLNEAGDYIGTRRQIREVTDLQVLFGHPVVPRRRRFYPTLVLGDDLAPLGDMAGVYVRWAIDKGTPGPLSYKELGEMKFPVCHLLQKECGIRFAGQFPPRELINAGVDPYSIIITITATIRDDQRISYTASNLGDSVLGRPNPLLLDASHRFAYRQQATWSDFSTDVQRKARKAALADDRAAMREFTEKLVQSWNMADVAANVTIEGLDGRQYQPGQVVSKIQGREIILSGTAKTAAEPRYPQIVGIVYDFQRQKRTLNLQTMREEHLTRALR